MFRQLRRINQGLSDKECEDILIKGSSGVLALSGDNDYPYALPISYYYDRARGVIIFHCAKKGHKIDAIARNEKASFCVVAQDNVIPQKYVTDYKSVIVFGKIKIVSDEESMRRDVFALSRKYCPDESGESINEEIDRFISALCILEMNIESISGKKANLS